MSELASAAPAAPVSTPSSPAVGNSPEASAVAANAAASTDVAAAAAGAKEVPTPPTEPRKFKVKVDGEDVTMSEEELVKHASLGKAAYKRMEEAAHLRKNIDAFIDLLKTNPKKVLADPALGLDLKKFAEDIINGEIEEMKKTPEQKEKEKMSKELDDLREKYKTEEEARRNSEMSRLRDQEIVKLDHDITQALESSGLPRNTFVVKRVADYMLTALQNNINVEVKDVIPLVRKELGGDLRNLFSAAPEDVLEDLIGRDGISKMRKRSIAKAKALVAQPPSTQVKPTSASLTTKTPVDGKKTLSMRDFMKL